MSRHPKGLIILFFTELWERFSFYGMKVLLVLFLVSDERGGFGWSNDSALSLLGIYMMMVYVMSIPGGILADRVFGQRRSVLIGGALLCVGHGMMVIPAVWSFYTALVFIVCGVGLLKPNISTMVGSLYSQNDPKREEGFTIFYMGINLGSFIATLLVAYVGERIGWHLGFSLAGIGMLLGQIVFVLGRKHLHGVGEFVPTKAVAEEPRHSFSPTQKDRIKVILISLIVVFVFWVSFEQASGLLTLYTKQYTNRVVLGWEIPTSMFQSLNAGFILLFGTAVAGFWARRAKRGARSSTLFKMGIGTIILGLGYVFMIGASLERSSSLSGQSALFWLATTYLFHTIGELCLSPVALAFITRVSPKRIVGTMMGLFWAATGLANFFAAQVGRLAGNLGEMAIFGGLIAFCTIMGSLLALFSGRLNRLTHGYEGGDPELEKKIVELPIKADPVSA